MTKRNLEFAFAAIKFTLFAVVSLIVTYMLIVVMGGSGSGDQREYRAVFESASSLVKGDDVRVAGIISGRVTDVRIHDRDKAMVTFELDGDVPFTADSELTVRFLNLIGDRYLAVTAGDQDAPAQQPGSTIGTDRTHPALNLTELFNGFQPLFTALDPDQVNELSMNIVQVLQGESGTIQDLMANTASLTNSLADRDELIGQVIDNLNELMGIVDSRHQELGDLVAGLDDWFGDLAADRSTIGASFDSVADLSGELADLLTRSRPLLKADVAELRRLLEILNQPQNKAILDETLEKLPVMLSKQTRIGVYGSWYNYYLCEFRGGVVLTDELMALVPAEYRSLMTDFTMYSNAARCQR
ncbi:MAG TPA: MlaD family protein [Aeromicrobium sp.]|nr:MlaD family protein [Aeromicrobium sp.]